ncbi:RING-H2 finger protein ATL52-like [Rutidosis leptorrhynchoides]|uniref:RING-H2 finger protein ATL52-like n=1 Tax=Rutidosis leptorrhynchoides TaxID=125765 RepID=UPI003A9982C8
MGSIDTPTTWVPYMNNQDCSQKICNLYCPQWCNYVVFPSPPPPIGFSDEDPGGATLSPFMITIIGVFGSACLLISYYVIISRLCNVNNDSSNSLRQRGFQNQQTLDMDIDVDDFNMDDDPLNLGPWHVPGKGLDESMINSIRVCKYKKGDSLVSGTDCTICLGEFQEDEKLKLLPKCSHAFHIYCIDTWLMSHSNCSLCRANVRCVNVMSHVLPPPPPPPPPPPRPEVSVSGSDLRGRDSIIEIREEENEREVRRSLSMGNFCQTRVSIADILFFNRHDEMQLKELQIGDGVGSSRQVLKSEHCQYGLDVECSEHVTNEHNICLNSDNVSLDTMKRSFSSGRYLFRWKGKTLRVSSVP